MVRVAQLRATYLVPASHPAPDAMKARLDEVAGSMVPAALASVLADALPDDDQSIWIIRRMQVACNVDLAASSYDLGRTWAGRIAHSLIDLIAEGSENPDVVHFANPAAMLVNYLMDSAAGDANRKWWYSKFSGLRLLPASAAMRTAICEDADTGMAALELIPAEAAERTLSALTEADAARILDRVAAGPARPDAESIIEIWKSIQPLRLSLAQKHRHVLRLFIEAGRRRTQLRSAGTRAAAYAIVTLLGRLEQLSPAGRRPILESLASGDAPKIYAAAGTADAEALMPLGGVRLDLLESLSVPARPVANETEPERKYTPFGGAFLLLPLLDELPLESAAVDPILFRFWILLKCLGGQRAMSFFFDPLMRELFGLSSEFSEADFAAWQRSLPLALLRDLAAMITASDYRRDNAGVPSKADRSYFRLPKGLRYSVPRDDAAGEIAHLTLRNFAWRLPGFSRSSCEHLYANFLDVAASLEEQPERRVVRLARAPLGLVLNLAGLSRSTYFCSWLGERPFELFPEG